jgi:hypothetical protein
MTSSKGGPTTDLGKAVASRNAVTHGLTAKRWINPIEHQNYNAPQNWSSTTTGYPPNQTTTEPAT